MLKERCRCGKLFPVNGREDEGKLFFKIMLGDFMSKLHIPPKFISHIDLHGKMHDNATLSSCMARSWEVIIRKREETMFMEDGWREFVQYHSIKAGDFVLFEYNDSLDFHIKVFDITACESVKRTNPVEFDEEISQAKPSKDTEETVEVDSSDDSSEDAEEMMEVDSSDDSPYDWNSPHVNPRRGKPRIFNACYISRRRPVTEAERTRAFAKAKSFMKFHPHLNREQCFVVTMGVTCVYKRFYLSIPMDFGNKFRLQRVSDVFLRSSDNTKQYRASLTETYRRRCRLIGGWGYFSLGNNLEEGDICLFELTKIEASAHPKKKRKCAFNVHIFRVVDQITPLQLKR